MVVKQGGMGNPFNIAGATGGELIPYPRRGAKRTEIPLNQTPELIHELIHQYLRWGRESIG